MDRRSRLARPAAAAPPAPGRDRHQAGQVRRRGVRRRRWRRRRCHRRRAGQGHAGHRLASLQRRGDRVHVGVGLVLPAVVGVAVRRLRRDRVARQRLVRARPEGPVAERDRDLLGAAIGVADCQRAGRTGAPALVALPSRPILVAPAGNATGIVWPAASMVSLLPGRHVRPRVGEPPAVTVPPGVTPAAASALAEYSRSPVVPGGRPCPSDEMPIVV